MTKIILDTFKSTLSKNFTPKGVEMLLCAVSGGVDSMVMLHLLLQSGYRVAVAHVDHQTRNGQSTEDADFVRMYCEKHALPYHQKTITEGDLKGYNFQSEARSFRYDFFDSLCKDHNYPLICTAHHKDDRVETLIMNLAKAAGIKGLSTLSYAQGNRLRPLLPFTKSQIEAYATAESIPFVHDMSNDGDDYTRNKVRHHLIPKLVEIFPDFVQNAARSAKYLNQDKQLLDTLIAEMGLTKDVGTHTEVDLSKVKAHKAKSGLAFHLLSPYGYSLSDVNNILAAKTSGLTFDTSDYSGILHQGNLHVKKKQGQSGSWELIIENVATHYLPNGQKAVLSKSDHDNNSIGAPSLPITLRSPKPGDSFKPWHMDGKSKKLKKLYSDKKLSAWQRDNSIIVECKGEIICVIANGEHYHTSISKSQQEQYLTLYNSEKL